MAKNATTRKLLNARSKGLIALILLLAITVIVSCLSITGMHYGEDGVNVLLPWVPVSAKNWPEALNPSRALGGGSYILFDASVADGESLEDALATSKASMEARLEALGETNAKVTVEGEKIRMELPKMDSEALHGWIEFLEVPGIFTLQTTAGDEVFKGAFKNATIAPNQSGRYEMTVEFSKEDTQIVKGLTEPYYNAMVDGQVLANYISLKDGKAVIDFGTNVNTAYNVLVWCQNPVPATISHSHENEGEVAATFGVLLAIVPVVCAVLLAAGLIYLVATAKLTGFAAAVTAWCAVMLECFFYATLVRTTLTIANLLMLVVGVVLALYIAFLRTKSISALIAEGNAPKSASKLGLRTCAKQVWIAHGVVLALSLVLMICPFCREVGYSLCCGVAASAIVMPVMRLFQVCFTAITNKASLFGKVK